MPMVMSQSCAATGDADGPASAGRAAAPQRMCLISRSPSWRRPLSGGAPAQIVLHDRPVPAGAVALELVNVPLELTRPGERGLDFGEVGGIELKLRDGEVRGEVGAIAGA